MKLKYTWIPMAALLAIFLYSGPVFAQANGASGLSTGAGQVDPQAMQQLMNQMMQDPESMRLIQELQNDPEMQKILNDPELVKAAQEQDAARLAQDPKIQALQNNKNLQKLIERNR